MDISKIFSGKFPYPFRDMNILILGFFFVILISKFGIYDKFRIDFFTNIDSLGRGLAISALSYTVGRFLKIIGDTVMDCYYFLIFNDNKTKTILGYFKGGHNIENSIGHWQEEIRSLIFIQSQSILESISERLLMYQWFFAISLGGSLLCIFLISPYFIIPSIILFPMIINADRRYSTMRRSIRMWAKNNNLTPPASQ